MPIVTYIVGFLDKFQQRHRPLAFSYAVIKKYSEDQGGFQAALLTYYGFLSLFPLLLVFTTLVQLTFRGESHFRQRLIDGVTTYFPIIGDQLQASIHSSTKSGLGLFVALLFTLYGTRGVADVLRNCANDIWRVPENRRDGFFRAHFKNIVLIVFGGAGLVSAAVVASYANSIGRDPLVRGVLLLMNLALVFLSFAWIMRVAPSKRASFQRVKVGAAVATLGVLILQNVGGYVVTHELKNLHNVYGTFAVVLGLLFWIYLQTQLLIYAMEIDTVRDMKLWPRSLADDKVHHRSVRKRVD